MIQKKNSSFFIFLFLLFYPAYVWGGGPFKVDSRTSSGTPARWGYNAAQKKWVMEWRVDQGPLNRRVNHNTALQWLSEMFQKWSGVRLKLKDGSLVPSVALQFVSRGSTDENITSENYQQYIEPQFFPDGTAVVIFDEDGSIVEKFCLEEGGGSEEDCRQAKNHIAGMGSPYTLDAATKVIRKGFIILNGRLVDGINNEDNNEIPDLRQFKAIILHELGHLSNLDHAQINMEMVKACEESGQSGCVDGVAVPTMSPKSLTVDQYTLHRDDQVAISWLYPTDDFKEKFCTIVGEVKSKKGKSMQGINVLAANVADEVIDVRSFVSGARYPHSTENGEYILAGIVPEERYSISFEPIHEDYLKDARSTVGPMGIDSPKGFSPSLILGSGGTQEVGCDRGGEEISIPAAVVGDLVVPEGAAPEGGTKSEGFCHLVPLSSFEFVPFLQAFLLLLSLIFARQRF